SRQQHAAADQHLSRARRDATGLCASADDPWAGRREALEAARRGQRARISADGRSAAGDAELHRAARVVVWRSGDLYARRADSAFRSGPRESLGRELRSDEAAVGEPAASDDGAGRADRAVAGRAAEAAGTRPAERAG